MFRKHAFWRSFPNAKRIFHGGRPDDTRRRPRYVVAFIIAAACLWLQIATYITMTPRNFTSEVSLILPGSGAQASVSLADLGQASSSAASAFSSSRISPTQTYKRLLSANRILERAADRLDMTREALGKPRIKLVDETSLIHLEMTGPSPDAAQARAATVLDVFLDELDTLRQDELAHRERAARSAISDYEQAVNTLRTEIATLQADSGLVSFDHYKDIVAERDDIVIRLAEARAASRSADASMEALANRLGADAATAALNLRLHADPEFQELARLLAEQRGELAQARGRFGARHPKVTSAWHAAAGTETELLDRGQTVAGTATLLTVDRIDLSPDPARTALLSDLVEQTAVFEAKASAVTSLEGLLRRADDRIARLAPLAARLDDLSRDYQVAEAVFASALARTDTSKSDIYASYPLVQVLADASLPDRASSPRPKIAIAAGVVATGMLFVALVLAWLRRPLIDRLLKRAAT